MKFSKIQLIFFSFFFIIKVYSQTSINGGNVSGRWQLSNSPYYVVLSITIPEGDSLIVEPGVCVYINSGATINVKGRINAIGTNNDTITFNKISGSSYYGWGGFIFNNTSSLQDSSFFQYCKIAYATNSNTFSFNRFSKCRIENCLFQTTTPINLKYSSLLIKNNVFKISSFSSWSIVCDSSSSPIIENNIITHDLYNQSLGISCGYLSSAVISGNTINAPSAGIKCQYSLSPIILNNNITGEIYCRGGSITITGNTIHNGGKNGISLISANGTINNNVINNADSGICCTQSIATINGNIIKYNQGIGIWCNSSSVTIFNDSILYNASGGIRCKSSSASVSNNVICYNKHNDRGGGVCGYSNSVLTITGNKINNNSATNGGGGIYNEYKATINNNEISNNILTKYPNVNSSRVVTAGAGIYSNSNSTKSISTSVITHNVINNNQGLGIYCDDSATIIRGNTITNNIGGMTCILPPATSTIIDSNTVTNNRDSMLTVGGISFSQNGAGSVTIAHNTVSYNEHFGMQVASDTARIIDNIISYNGSGIFINTCRDTAYNATRGGPKSTSSISNNFINGNKNNGIYCVCSPTIEQNIITNNYADEGGGGIFAAMYTRPYILKNVISNNKSGISNLPYNGNWFNYGGGGIHCTSGSIIINCLISNNYSSYGGGGIFFFSGNNYLKNCTIVNNNSGTLNGGGGIYGWNASGIMMNSIVWGNISNNNKGNNIYAQPQPGYFNLYITNSDVQGHGNLDSANHNIDTIPYFVSPSTGVGVDTNGTVANWSLKSNSSCIDKGNSIDITNLPITDLSNNPRVTPCIVDMGAYEYQYGVPFMISTSQQNVSCNGGNNGTATVTGASGGVFPLHYLWSNGETTPSITGLSQGYYTITVTDASNCERKASINITQPNAITTTFSKTNVTCNGKANGIATVNATGGHPPYSYAWSNSQTSKTITGLAAGTYTVTVSDTSGCNVQKTTTISQPAVLSASISSVNIKCHDKNNGSATAIPYGGNGPYMYIWKTNPIQNTSSITNLTPGTYSVTIIGACGDTAIASTIISQPSSILTNSMMILPPECNGTNGSVTAVASGGIPPYIYSWNNGSTSSNINISGTTSTPIQTYVVSITDANGNGCTIKDTAVVQCLVGIEDNSLENRILIYPNPTSDKITILLENNIAEKNYMIEIRNVLGEVLSNKISNNKSEIISIDSEPGVYFLLIKTSQETIERKIIKR